MSQEQFDARVRREMKQLDAHLTALEATGTEARLARENLDFSGFPADYRRLCQRLAIARHRRYSPALVGQLNQLVVRGHAQLYRRERDDGMLDKAAMMLVHRFPRSLRERSGPLALSCLLFFGVALVTFVAILINPELVHTILSPLELASMESMYDPSSTHFLRPRDADSDFAMFGYYIRNNVGIALRTFGSGLALGVGTMYVLIYNGLVLAAVAAHLTNVGSAVTFWPFVVGHAALELGAIAIAGAAGLRVGLAIVSPGNRTRTLAMREEAAAVVPMIAGFVAMLVLAACVEAFWSSQHHLGDTVRYIAGAFFAAVVALWLGGGGRTSAPVDDNAA